MGNLNKMATAVVAAAMLTVAPARADAVDQAEQLRRLDIMLMVTGLRCRTTRDDFQADYARFTTNHLSELNAASSTLRRNLAARYGDAGTDRALDRMSTVMANQYGGGHPWLDCAQLKSVARELAETRDAAVLAQAASDLLSAPGGQRLAWSRR